MLCSNIWYFLTLLNAGRAKTKCWMYIHYQKCVLCVFIVVRVFEHTYMHIAYKQSEWKATQYFSHSIRFGCAHLCMHLYMYASIMNLNCFCKQWRFLWLDCLAVIVFIFDTSQHFRHAFVTTKCSMCSILIHSAAKWIYHFWRKKNINS